MAGATAAPDALSDADARATDGTAIAVMAGTGQGVGAVAVANAAGGALAVAAADAEGSLGDPAIAKDTIVINTGKDGARSVHVARADAVYVSLFQASAYATAGTAIVAVNGAV